MNISAIGGLRLANLDMIMIIRMGMLNMMIMIRKLNMMVMIRKLMMIIMTIRRNPAPFEALDLQNRHLAIDRE